MRFFINTYKVNFTKTKYSITFQSKAHLILLFEAIYWRVAWFRMGTILCSLIWKTHNTFLRLVLSYQTSNRTENVPLSEKGYSRMAQDPDCMPGVKGIQSRWVLWSFPWFVWWCSIWYCLDAEAIDFEWPLLRIFDSALHTFHTIQNKLLSTNWAKSFLVKLSNSISGIVAKCLKH